MRTPAALAAVAGVLLFGGAIVAAGSSLKEPAFEISEEDIATLDAVDQDALMAQANEDETPAAPQIDARSGLERLPARQPLSDLSAPSAPRRPNDTPPDRWLPQRLFNPTATAAGIIEAKGYRVALAGIESLSADQNCDWQGKAWPCGTLARTAFRAWLRARAILCKLPPVADRQATVAECRVGNEDPAEWLAANGWTRARVDGPYAELGQKAHDARKGIFGEPQQRVLFSVPAQAGAEPEPATPPAAQPAPAR